MQVDLLLSRIALLATPQAQKAEPSLLLLLQQVSLRVDQLLDTLNRHQFVLDELQGAVPRALLVRTQL